MRLPRFAPLLVLVIAASPLAAQAAPRVATTLPPDELAALEVIRRDVWVNWFAGDTAALRRILGPELIAISPDSRLWQSLDQTLAGAAEFRAGGGRLVSVTFEGTTIHRLGEVVVMFSRYALDMERGEERFGQAGRATEVFVRSQGRWVHTSWHLDVDR